MNLTEANGTKYAVDFLTFEVGARALAMGGAFSAIADDASAAHWNPAGLGTLRRREMIFMRSSIGKLDHYNFVSYVHPLGKSGSIGLSWLLVGTYDIPTTSIERPTLPVSVSNPPKIVGTFDNFNNAFSFIYGKKSKKLSIGMSAKLIYVSTFGNQRAIALSNDFGVKWEKSIFGNGLSSIGIVGHNLFGTRLHWSNSSEAIDRSLRFGISSEFPIDSLKSKFILAVEIDTLHGLELHYGGELTFMKLLSIRLGGQEREGVRTLRSTTAGVGLQLLFLNGGVFSIDYAFLSDGSLGNSSKISARLIF